MRYFLLLPIFVLSAFLLCSCGTESTSTYTLTTSVVGEGSITPSGGTYEEGETVTLTSTPSESWVFNNWSGDASGNTNPLSVTMDSDKSITASFTPRDTNTAVVEVTSPTGRIWMDRNLGASRVATSSTDELAYGDLYQWGRAADGHQKRNSYTTRNISNTNQPGHSHFILAGHSPFDWLSQNSYLWQGVDGINNPCPVGYRLPTDAEWEDEINSWGEGNQNATSAFASPLALPMAGGRAFNGSISNSGSYGYYWSTRISGTSSGGLIFNSSDAFVTIYYRANGRSVRCLKN